MYSAAMNLKSLNTWNARLAVLHFVQAIAVVLLTKSIAWPVTTAFLSQDTIAAKVAGHPVLSPASHTLYHINIAYLVAAFFLLSAIAHGIIATKYRKTYEAELKKGINKARWIEYSISSSVMMVAIALLTGVYDASSLFMIAVFMFITNMLGLVMEYRNQGQKKIDWLPFWLGVVTAAAPWVVVLKYILGTTIYGSGGIPTFVYFIYGSMLLLFSSFAVNMYLQYVRKGKWANYLYGERGYMILSLVAKTALAWQIFFGALRP